MVEKQVLDGEKKNSIFQPPRRLESMQDHMKYLLSRQAKGRLIFFFKKTIGMDELSSITGGAKRIMSIYSEMH